MLTYQIYPIFQAIVVAVVTIVALLMITRLILNYVDPNPFGTIGQFEYFLKKRTERLVEPSAMFLAGLGIDTRIAPLITIFAFCIFGYFFLQLLYNVLFIVDGLVISVAEGNLVRLIGFILYGFLAIYSLLIVMRVVFSWFMSWMNPLMRLLIRVTDPILEPFRRLIPPVGFLDISPIVVLFILWFLQTAVAGVFLR
jgi:YggT family protein